MELEINNVVVHYDKVEAVKNVCIRVEKGTIVSLIGGNGAGKSTILRTVMGLKELTSGEVLFNGERINGLDTPQIARKGVALCMEGRRLFPKLTVFENLEMGAFTVKSQDQINKGIEDVYDLFPILRDRHKQQADTLSGGQQQMLAIGRALMAKPSLLLLDEPSLGLAPKMVRELGDIIKNINSKGTTVFLVEQNSKLGLGIAERAYVLEVGRISMEGYCKDLIDHDHIKKIYLGV